MRDVDMKRRGVSSCEVGETIPSLQRDFSEDSDDGESEKFAEHMGQQHATAGENRKIENDGLLL